MSVLRTRRPAALASFMLLCVGCSAGDRVDGQVLREGQCVEATNANGHVRVCYVDSLRRRYEWNGQSQVVKMMQRPEPFEGKTGLYDPAARFVFDNATPRLVVEESVLTFDTVEQFHAFLWPEAQSQDWVYTRDGLIVGFSATPARNQANVDVFRATIGGKRPENLDGARDSAVRLTSDARS